MKRVIVLCTILILSACSTTTQTRTPLDLPYPDPITTKPVEFHVVVSEQCEGMDPSVEKGVLIGVSEVGYRNLAENIRSMLNFIILQRTIIDSYKKYYEGGGK